MSTKKSKQPKVKQIPEMRIVAVTGDLFIFEHEHELDGQRHICMSHPGVNGVIRFYPETIEKLMKAFKEFV